MNSAFNRSQVGRPSFGSLALVAVALLFSITACRPEEASDPASASPAASAAPASTAAAAAPSDASALFQGSSETLFEAATPAELAKLQILQQATVSQTSDGISLQATGNDPSLMLPEFPMKPCVVKIEITSPGDTVLQIFYLVGPQTVYTEANSAVQKIKAGKNIVYLRIDALNLTGRWRFDPGDVPGAYVIHGMEVRAISSAPLLHSSPVTQLSEKDLADAFDASTDILFRAKTAFDLKLQSLQDVTIAETPEGVSLTASGIDPAVFLPEFSVKPCVVKVEISSPADTVFQIFYPVGPQAVYSEQNSVTQRIKRGGNMLYLRIDKANATGKWRLDPGGVPGRYVIHSFEVRGLPPPR